METKTLGKIVVGIAGIALVVLQHTVRLVGLILVRVLEAAAEATPQNDEPVNGFGLIHTSRGVEYGCRGDGPDARIFTDHH